MDYKNRLKNTEIYNDDYKLIINNFDSINTFFFLDPPYEIGGIYKHNNMNFEELNNILLHVKGKFLLTLNDSENIKNIFNSFNIQSIQVNGGNNNNFTMLGKGVRNELIITNY